MDIINFAEQNSIINQYMAELRDKNYQKNRLPGRGRVHVQPLAQRADQLHDR